MNILKSFKGKKSYLNNDSATAPFLATKATGEIYLNYDMSSMFNNCSLLVMNLDETPFNYDLVVDMACAYNNCRCIIGSPKCGDNVVNMFNAYQNCTNLTGNPVCGNNVTSMSHTYYDCKNLNGNFYIHSNLVNNTNNMLFGHNSQLRINIYVRPDTVSNTTIYSNQVGCGEWTLDNDNNCYYNLTNNIYVYYNWDGIDYDKQDNLSYITIEGAKEKIDPAQQKSIQLTPHYFTEEGYEYVFREQQEVTWSCSDNATITSDGLLTINDDFEYNTVVTITATSIYDNTITATISINLIETPYSINLNNGQWIESATTIDDCSVYKSNIEGQKNTKARAIITIKNCETFKLMVRTNAEAGYDYLCVGNLDCENIVQTKTTNETIKWSGYNKSNANTYTELIFDGIDGGEHTIELLYAKDSSGDIGEDAAFFYIPEQ